MKNRINIIRILFVTLFAMLSTESKSQQTKLQVNEFGFIESYKDSCCEYKTLPDTEIEGFYVLNFIDTIYFKEYRNLLNCLSIVTSLSNPLKYCKIQSFGKPITGHLYVSYTDKDSIKRTYQGVVKNGYYFSGVFIDYFPNGIIKRTSQVENGWLSGLSIDFYENGRIRVMERNIQEVTYSVTYWEYDSDGVLIDFSDDSSLFENFENNYD